MECNGLGLLIYPRVVYVTAKNIASDKIYWMAGGGGMVRDCGGRECLPRYLINVTSIVVDNVN